ncbi:AdoMet-dependent rRNA methyltransferase SPB1 [Paragonimus westermani]|uniref:AdoMet-dependent rRNA methyltransferase SPB1 n=1 Tax=Paragonimus westermani TaxID=34504 RepID=A0A5J4N7K0_9TREM|nr:AdoMet-dependent rRNA methyltransferase SPB1 [Paragonimus westermani]
MGKKSKIGKARKDRFYFLAKETGYRSRAAFKLIQLNRRFNFLNTSKILIDLCAAPGGWLQVASKEMPVTSQIIGVDLIPIKPIPRVKTFVADITTEKCKQLIRAELLPNKADVVLHDGAPNVGTAWSVDEYAQANLCLQAFALATDVLRRGGWFITKVFRSRDYEPLKWVLSQFFKTVRPVKPEASRMESAEIFLVGQFYKAPDRIDPRFLDSRHVFGEIEIEKDRSVVVSSLLKECKRKRKAEGYAEGDILYHELRVSDFLQASDPLETLARANKVVLDLKEVENHPLTTEAVKSDMEDIQVLGKADIKNLLKWRKKIIAELNKKLQQDSPLLTETQPHEPVESELLDEEELDELKVEEDIHRLLNEEAKVTKK